MEERLENITFEGLVSQIERTNDALRNNARLVINRHVTAKAWLTGYYIVVYEQNGSDRAKYGERLLQNLAKRLGNQYALSTLKLYRLFYLTYPQLGSVISDYLIHIPIGQSVISQLLLPSGKSQSVISQLDSKDSNAVTIRQSQIAQFDGVNPDMLFNRLSFTHFAAILPCKDPLQRAFYETMAIRGTWSVRELQRQIDSNYYVRSGWSKKPDKLAELVDGKAEKASLKMYLAYFRKNIMQPDDNTPIGILMCSEIGQEMAEYTLLDTGEDLFISKYELSLPSKERMTEFLRKENEGLVKE